MVDKIPEGFHTLTPYLIVRDAGAAIAWYSKAFGAVERFRMPGPDGQTVMHAEIQIGDSILMLSEENMEMGFKSPAALGGTGVVVHLYVEDADAVHKQATDAGAESIMPVMDMFWGDRFGKVKDPYGHEWSIATHTEDVPPEEMDERMKKAFAEECEGQPQS